MNRNRLSILLEKSQPDGTCFTTHRTEIGGGAAIVAETGILLYSLVRRLQPRLVVETGTHWGASSGWIASALADTIELYPEKPELHGRLVTVDVDVYERRAEALWDRLGVHDYIQRIVADSRTLDIPDDIRGIDLLWLDA